MRNPAQRYGGRVRPLRYGESERGYRRLEHLEEGKTSFKRKQLGDADAGNRLRCSFYEIPPGKRSWFYHYHAGNDEALFVLAGAGALRLAGETLSLSEGDYVALPTDESGAHRVVNDSDEPLTYVVVSTMDEPDVTVYPDSEEFGAFVGSSSGGHDARTLHGYYRVDDSVDD